MKIINLDTGMAVLAHFNGFHDGFIKSIEIESADKFEEIGVQDLTGVLRLRIRFSHYNFPGASRGIDQTVTASFSAVRDLHLDFSGQRSDWTISAAMFRLTDRIGDYGKEDCLAFEISQRRGVNPPSPVLQFTFKDADFEAD